MLLQLTDLFSQGRMLRHLPQQLADLLSQPRIFRFQSGYVFFCSHGPIVAAYAIPYLSSYLSTMRKQGHAMLAALAAVFAGKP